MIALIAALAPALAAGEPFAWPLERPRELTSSFAEYRPGRFHAGIDLRTGGIGLPIAAAGDGYVSRVRCSPYGYGKAVYLTLDAGYTVVYGHLDGFNDALAAHVRAAQHAAQDYTVDLAPAPGQFRVKRGDRIAYSGQTGIGAPHLHFEWRDAQERPVDVYALGLRWPDAAAPRFERIALLPHPEDGRVDGDLVPVTAEVQRGADGRHAAGPFRVRGRVAFAVQVSDPAAGGARLGVHRIAVRDGGTERFRMQHDRLDYGTMDHGAVAYHPYLGGQMLTLFRWPDNRTESYAQGPGDGWIEAGDAPRTLTIEAADVHGNAALLEVRLVPDAAEAPTPAAPAAAGRGAVALDCHGNALTVSVTFSQPEAEAPAVHAEYGGAAHPIAAVRTGADAFRANIVPASGGPLRVRVTHPRVPAFEQALHAYRRGESGAPAAEGGARLEVPADAPFGLLFARIEREDAPPKAPLPGRGPAWRVWPEDSPLDAAARLTLPWPEGATRDGTLAVYRWAGKYWTVLDTTRDAEGLHVETRRFGLFRVHRDTAAPYLGKVSLPEAGGTTGARPKISASVSDIGSGIASVEIRCDGRWLITAYDPERNHMHWEAGEDLAPGPHTITLRARDGAGNETAVTRSITVAL